jgi:hypothetical protein
MEHYYYLFFLYPAPKGMNRINQSINQSINPYSILLSTRKVPDISMNTQTTIPLTSKPTTELWNANTLSTRNSFLVSGSSEVLNKT